MGTELDLHDVAHGQPLAARELDALTAERDELQSQLEASRAACAEATDEGSRLYAVARSVEAERETLVREYHAAKDEIDAVYRLQGVYEQAVQIRPLAQWVLTRFVTVEAYNVLAAEVERLKTQVGQVSLSEYMRGEEVTRLQAEVERLKAQNVAPLVQKIDELNRENMRLREALEGFVTWDIETGNKLAFKVRQTVARAALGGDKA